MNQNYNTSSNKNDNCSCGFSNNLKDNCECCQGIKKTTPKILDNSPGKSSITYRVGTYIEFLQSMITSISTSVTNNDSTSSVTSPSIISKKLGLRTPLNDLTISLLDVWAIVCDVISFYQERIANESFLRTATEIKSIIELAR